MDKTFTISIYSENNVGLLNRISSIFLKRHINIESLRRKNRKRKAAKAKSMPPRKKAKVMDNTEEEDFDGLCAFLQQLEDEDTAPTTSSAGLFR